MEQSIFFYLLTLAWMNFAAGRNPMVNPGMVEGDMLVPEVDGNRNVIQLWPDGVIPYEVDSNLGNPQLTVLLEAMRHIEARTCIKFVPRSGERDYVRVIYGNGCYAHWGRVGGEQLLSLGDLCEFLGTAIHELLHAIGFQHEHNRSDRDDYLNIHWENIIEDWYYAFEKLKPSENRLLTPFDYHSVMLYGSSTFSKGDNLHTMVTKSGEILTDIYMKDGMTQSDIQRVKMLYDCPN